MLFNNKDKIGFTLAEILLALLIVGIVASMTIPAIVNDIRNKDLEIQNNNLRSTLLRAHQLIRIENGGTMNGVNYGQEMSKKLNLAKNCIKTPQVNGCWHAIGEDRMPQSDNSYLPFTTSAYSQGIILQNGTMLKLSDGWITNCNERFDNWLCYKNIHYVPGFCGSFYADINGKEGPNIYGKDIREITVWDTRITMLTDSTVRWYSRDENPDANLWLPGGACYSTNNYTHTKY